jgi:hypothetical protein
MRRENQPKKRQHRLCHILDLDGDRYGITMVFEVLWELMIFARYIIHVLRQGRSQLEIERGEGQKKWESFLIR